jgi:hypothetical protein
MQTSALERLAARITGRAACPAHAMRGCLLTIMARRLAPGDAVALIRHVSALTGWPREEIGTDAVAFVLGVLGGTAGK